MVFQSLVTGAWWIETSLLFCVSRNSVPEAAADTPEPREGPAGVTRRDLFGMPPTWHNRTVA